jgi:hypothetical protein
MPSSHSIQSPRSHSFHAVSASRSPTHAIASGQARKSRRRAAKSWGVVSFVIASFIASSGNCLSSTASALATADTRLGGGIRSRRDATKG